MHFIFVILPTRVSYRDGLHRPAAQAGKLSYDSINDFHDRELAELHFPLQISFTEFKKFRLCLRLLL